MFTLGAILLTVSLSFGLADPGSGTTPPAFQAVEREAHLVCAGLTRLVNNLRLVYDLRTLAETEAPTSQPGSNHATAGKALLGIDLSATSQPSPPTARDPARDR